MENTANANEEQDHNIKLQPGEVTRVTIIQTEKGEILIGVDSLKKLDTLAIIGMVEICKAQLVENQRGNIDENQVVEVEIDELDFEMDTMKMMEKQGFKVGDKRPMSLALVELREVSRREYLKQKNINANFDAANQTPAAPETPETAAPTIEESVIEEVAPSQEAELLEDLTETKPEEMTSPETPEEEVK